MKIVHVYAQNLSIFVDAVEGTGCFINGSTHLDYMRKSLSNFNARDVMGMIVFANPMTKRTMKLVKAFDSLNVFHPLPIIIISDQVTELYAAKRIRVKYSPLFLVDSFENTISDVDIQRVFATLSCMSDEMYDLSAIEAHGGTDTIHSVESTVEASDALANDVLAEYAKLGGE